MRRIDGSWRGSFPAWIPTQSRRKPIGEALYHIQWRKALRNLLGSSDLSRFRNELYRGLVVGSDSDPLEELLGWLLEEICSQWNWAPGSGFLNNSEFSFTLQLARNVLPFADWTFKVGLVVMPDCPCCSSGLEEMALYTSYNSERFRPFWSHVGEWTTHINPKQLVLWLRRG